jgi:selenocysteine-specific elongation factor
VRAALLEQLSRFHGQNPLRRGMARSEARNRLQEATAARSLSVRLFNGWIDALAAEGVVQADDAAVWLAYFKIQLDEGQERCVAAALAALHDSPFAPPAEADVLRLLRGESALLEMLIEQGKVIRIGGNVLFATSAFDEMIEHIRAFATERGTISLAEARDLFDTSRKYAQAVLEEMDARRITRREGETRILRG